MQHFYYHYAYGSLQVNKSLQSIAIDKVIGGTTKDRGVIEVIFYYTLLRHYPRNPAIPDGAN